MDTITSSQKLAVLNKVTYIVQLKDALKEAAYRNKACMARGPIITPNETEWIHYEEELEKELLEAIASIQLLMTH